MSRYAVVIRELLQKQYPSEQQTQLLSINSINCQFMSTLTQKYFQAYCNLKIMIFTHCDLRNLQNFPDLAQLTDLDISSNSLQGTFNFLMKLSRLQYLNVSNNLIEEVNKLQPLRKIVDLSICVKNNPFTLKDGYKAKIKAFNLTIVKEPKKLIQTKKDSQGGIHQLKMQNLKAQKGREWQPGTKREDIKLNQLRQKQRELQILRQRERTRLKDREDKQRQLIRGAEALRRNGKMYSRVRTTTANAEDQDGNAFLPMDPFSYRLPPQGMDRPMSREPKFMHRYFNAMNFSRPPNSELLFPSINSSPGNHIRRLMNIQSQAEAEKGRINASHSNLQRAAANKEQQQLSDNYGGSSDSASEDQEGKNQGEDDQIMQSNQNEQLQEQDSDEEELINQFEGLEEQISMHSEQSQNQNQVEAQSYGMFIENQFRNMDSFSQSGQSPSQGRPL